MALKLNDGTVLRNLEEQVQYLSDYHAINQGLAQWGIRVVGQVDTAAELPNPATYEGEYGDTYAVGTEAPFSFYIWTRASIEGENPYWFPFGEISIVGPQGPKGDKGDKGDTGESTKWYAGTYPSEVTNPKEGDLYLFRGDGDVYQYNGTTWRLITNIRGPQGPQGFQGLRGEPGKDGEPGPQGPQGDVGGFINIWGILTDVAQLPTPASLDNLTVAYLVEHAGGTDQENDHYDLYIQVGETSDTATWNNAGPFNAATLITSGGVGLNVWDADTKLDKVTTKTSTNQVYVKSAGGGQVMFPMSQDVINEALVQRRSDGFIFVPTNTTYSNAAISKYQADGSYITKIGEDKNNVRIVSQQTDRSYLGYVLATNSQRANQACIPLYLNDSVITTEPTASLPTKTPTVDYAAANKKYVDDGFVAKPSSSGVVRFNAADGTSSTYGVYQGAPSAQQIPLAKTGGRITTNTPTEELDCTNKKYVEDNFSTIYKHQFTVSGKQFTFYAAAKDKQIKSFDVGGSTYYTLDSANIIGTAKWGGSDVFNLENITYGEYSFYIIEAGALTLENVSIEFTSLDDSTYTITKQ